MKGQHLTRLLRDDSGQDLIEYGLLAAIIGIAGALVLPAIGNAMGLNFGNWGNTVYNLWASPPPGP